MKKEIIGEATLYLGDCREILPALNGIDAVVTDPPYGISYKHSGKGRTVAGRKSVSRHDESIHGDDAPFDPSDFLSFDSIVMFGANHYAHKLPPSGAWLVWDKRDGMDSNSFSDCEFAWTKGAGNAARMFRYLWNGVCQAGEKGERRYHPTQKPIALMEWCIKTLGSPASILDPFMGSGTTGVAAVRLGRAFVGIERESKYFDIACKRIDEAQRQVSLFEPPPAVKHEQMGLLA
jgi:site-specific DNA-methyltransferase (adenine-specific)/modification methylase